MYFLFLELVFLGNSVLAEDMKDLTPLELLKLGQDISQLHTQKVHPSDIQFYLLAKDDFEPVLITSENKEIIDNTKKTKIVIHGWLENHKRSWYKNIGEQYLENNNVNFIEVDWERAARIPYIYSAQSTKIIGNIVAQFIEDSGLSSKDIHLIGHSLGAHVAGFAAKKFFADTGKKFNRISGLDPAGPYFRLSSINQNERLDKNDADIVDVLHTDAGFYGYENPIGTLDIYVNGGQRIQPGCIDEWNNTPSSLGDILEKSFCSHARSTKYFTEWISKGKFICKFCQRVSSFNLYRDRCTLHYREQILGSEDVTINITGVCFTRTNKEEPYLT